LTSGGSAEVGAFGWVEAAEQGADARGEAIDGSCRFVLQQRLAPGEGHLDRVQIRAAGRQRGGNSLGLVVQQQLAAHVCGQQQCAGLRRTTYGTNVRESDNRL
jgi:hypothetical protein